MSDAANDVGPPGPQAFNFLAGGGEMGALIRGHDWGATPLGPVQTWPHSLRTAIRIMLTSRQPIWVGWGRELTYLYNDAYKSIIGGKHPWALGRPTSEVWREIWHDIGPLLDTAMGGVEGTYVEQQLLIMERNGYPEETYYTFSYSPIPDDHGAPGGIICANNEETPRVVGDRQLALLRELAAGTTNARSWRDACERAGRALAQDPHDLTFALLYMIEPGAEEAALAAAASLEAGDPAAPPALPLTGGLWPVAEVLQTREARVVELEGVAPGAAWPLGAWERPSSQAAVLPVPAGGDSGRAGVLVVGLNPYRLFDDGYRSFLNLAVGQVAAAVASADAYEAERRRAEALAELDHAKTLFFSNVSHEFRTPLTLMLGPLEEMLAGAIPPEAARTQLELAHRNGLRLLRLTNSLLDFSRIEAGRTQAVFQPTDLAAFNAEIASTFRSAIERAGLQLELSRDPLPAPVYLDRDMWEKVLLNLLSNAFKFTLQGRISVRASRSADGRAALVEVTDTGVGVPPEQLPRLFDRFYRVEGTHGRSFEGSGIGLALVKELVQLHGGTISAESTPGAGTTFRVSLPLGHAHLPADQVRESAAEALLASARAEEYVGEALRWLPAVPARPSGAAQAEAPAVVPMTPNPAPAAAASAGGRRVLLADDNADMRGYVQRLLEVHGYAVEARPDGEAALQAARREAFDLVLTDVMMPGLDGFGLLKALRAHPSTAAIPVIMLSARAGEEAKVEGLDAGADDYLAKPFAARELLARVKANIQMAEVRREASRMVFQSEQRFRMSEERLDTALSTGRVGVYEWDIDADRVAVLGPLAESFGVELTASESAELPISTFIGGIHPDDRERVGEAVARSVATGAPYEAEYRVVGGEETRTVLARGRVGTTPQGARRFVGALIDITEEKAAENAIREGRAHLRELLDSTGEGFYAVDTDGRTTTVNRAFLRMLGFASAEEVVGRRLHGLIHHSHADGSPYPESQCPLYRAAATGEPAHVEGELFFRQDGSSFPVEYRVQPIRRDGVLAGAICTFSDIGERLAAQLELGAKQAALQDQTRALEILNRAAAAMAGDLDLGRLVQTITDAGREVTGAAFGAFFYNRPDEGAETYSLYTLSGASSADFGSFPAVTKTAVFAPTFNGTGVVRSDDITADPRYGQSQPFRGMPMGHLPVRSYLAVPVRSRNGEVLGGLLFGHPQPGVFTRLAEDRVVGLASQAAVALDNASLFRSAQDELAQRRRAEGELQALNATLEQRVATEVAERAKAEEALRQAQKMEAVGQLTGGVAHDFNNLLTIIIGGLDTIRRAKPTDEARIKRATDMALQGAQRAASLTTRLLAFSRRQPLEPKPLDLNLLVRDMTELLHRTLGEQIELEGVLAPRLWTVEADQNQLESALINLAVNARDAMPDGGKLTIETANTLLDEGYAATDAEVVPGQYVAVSVSDSGSGMSKETLAKVFEPFFTTKEVGRGTGLGLSMVYGFVKQSGGHVTIYSEEGEGTTVKLYFPRFLGDARAAEDEAQTDAPRGSEGEVVLVVEDNDDVRAYSVMILTELGYQVVEAAEAESALAIVRSDRRIDLLFTDVVLPGPSGRVLVDAAQATRPGLKVLFTTGYSRNAIVHHGRLDAGVQLITKPFTFEQLAARVRDVLDRSTPRPRS